MTKTLSIAVFASLLALTLASCGSDKEASPKAAETPAAHVTTRADFVAAATALCKPLVATRTALAAKYFPSKTDPPTLKQMQSFYAAFSPTFTKMVDDFAKLEPAPADQAAFDAVVPVVKRVAKVAADASTDSALAKELMATDEAQLHEPDKALTALGVPSDC